ncbi:MAG: MFS transporter [Beutenbergiaceae bacterium]
MSTKLAPAQQADESALPSGYASEPLVSDPHRPADRPTWFLALALLLVGLNLRGAITSVAVVLPQIRAEVHMDAPTAALLTSLPLLTFAIFSASVTTLAGRLGVDRALIVSGIALAVFTFTRPFTPLAGLLLITVAIGVAITIGNVLVPVVVRRNFASRQGPMTSLTVGSITGGAAIVTALTVPIAVAVGWRWALAIWGITALGATAIYAAAARRSASEPALMVGRADTVPPTSQGWVWRHPGAWALAVYFALQSGSFYGAAAWLPTLIPALTGLSEQSSANAAALFQFMGIIGALTVPALTTRFSRRLVSVLVSAAWVVLSLGMLLAPAGLLVWLVISGFAQGGTFALVMTMLTMRARNAAAVRDLSGMVQAIGYAGAATVPVLMGWLLEGFGARASLGLLLATTLALVAAGAIIGSRKPI